MITQSYKKWFFIPFILLATLYACTSEYDGHADDAEKQIDPLTVATAQSLYEQYVGLSKLKNMSDDFGSGIELIPDWSRGQLSSDSNWYVVESPLEFEGNRQIRLVAPGVEDYARTHTDPSDIRQYQRLVMLQNKVSGDTYAFVMLVVPELEYMLRKGDELGGNRYLTRDSDLDGLVMFYTTDGYFVNGWVYREGKILEGIASDANQSNLFNTKAGGRICYGITEYYYEDGEWKSAAGIECGRPFLMDEFYEGPYGSGGGGVDPSIPPINDNGSIGSGGGSGTAPKAKAIFRNSNMTNENWELLEKMLDKIMKDCMGEALYNGLANSLNGKTLTIQFIPSGTGSYFSYNSYDGSTVGISLSTSMESNQLYHEMMHAYQAYQETEYSFEHSIINLEIEAFYAQYLYTSKLPEFAGSKWEKRYENIPLMKSIKDLEEFVDNKGNLISGKLVNSLDRYILTGPVAEFQKHNAYQYAAYNNSRRGLDNFKNMRILTQNCQ
ncbi:MAG: hypothetical protein ACK5M3_14245 [Dysgonomonas sp.]